MVLGWWCKRPFLCISFLWDNKSSNIIWLLSHVFTFILHPTWNVKCLFSLRYLGVVRKTCTATMVQWWYNLMFPGIGPTLQNHWYLTHIYIFIYLVGGLEHDFYEIPSNYWECHQPNWFIFFRGVSSNHQADISLRVPQGWPQIIHPVHVLEQFRQARGWKTEKTQWIPWEKKVETPGEKAKI